MTIYIYMFDVETCVKDWIKQRSKDLIDFYLFILCEMFDEKEVKSFLVRKNNIRVQIFSNI